MPPFGPGMPPFGPGIPPGVGIAFCNPFRMPLMAFWMPFCMLFMPFCIPPPKPPPLEFHGDEGSLFPPNPSDCMRFWPKPPPFWPRPPPFWPV